MAARHTTDTGQSARSESEPAASRFSRTEVVDLLACALLRLLVDGPGPADPERPKPIAGDPVGQEPERS
jgi:hypothetical protein